MNKEEKELRKYVDEYFDKYMCVSFDKFLENWEETSGLLKYFESKQNELQQRIDKALAYIERMTRIIDYDDDEFITWENISDIENILRGEDDEN